MVHLVIRPVDAPHNPMNGMRIHTFIYIYIYISFIVSNGPTFFSLDDPNPGASTRTNRAAPNGRSRTFPSISSRFPLMEGYAFITLDSTIGDIGDSQSVSWCACV